MTTRKMLKTKGASCSFCEQRIEELTAKIQRTCEFLKTKFESEDLVGLNCINCQICCNGKFILPFQKKNKLFYHFQEFPRKYYYFHDISDLLLVAFNPKMSLYK